MFMGTTEYLEKYLACLWLSCPRSTKCPWAVLPGLGSTVLDKENGIEKREHLHSRLVFTLKECLTFLSWVEFSNTWTFIVSFQLPTPVVHYEEFMLFFPLTGMGNKGSKHLRSSTLCHSKILSTWMSLDSCVITRRFKLLIYKIKDFYSVFSNIFQVWSSNICTF